MSYVPRALRALVLHVLCNLRVLVPYVPRVIRALVSRVPRALPAPVPYVPRALRAHVIFTFRDLVPNLSYVLWYLTCFLPCVFSFCSCLVLLLLELFEFFTASA